MTNRFAAAVWALLLAAAGVNLAAGARRPLRERAQLATGHYPAADRAAEAVRRLVTPSEPLTLVTYDGDMLDQLNCAVWAEYRLRWLLYPRPFAHLQVHPGDSALVPEKGAVLFFRVTKPVGAPASDVQLLASEPMFALVRRDRAP
jgi:hypothetical protein